MKMQSISMTLGVVMQKLEGFGTEQNRKIYRRHGAPEPLFGVSFANLNLLKKQIKIDHPMAMALWASGNYDARILATMVADPERVDETLLDAWAGDLGNYVLTDALAKLAAQSDLAIEITKKWTQSDEEWIGRAGWVILSQLAMKEASLPDSFFIPYIETIERNIHHAKNRVRDAMNNALIAIGIRNEALRPLTLAAAARIGKVEVDHGETNCKTPNAAQYINKSVAHQKRRHAQLKRKTL